MAVTVSHATVTVLHAGLLFCMRRSSATFIPLVKGRRVRYFTWRSSSKFVLFVKYWRIRFCMLQSRFLCGKIEWYGILDRRYEKWNIRQVNAQKKTEYPRNCMKLKVESNQKSDLQPPGEIRWVNDYIYYPDQMNEYTHYSDRAYATEFRIQKTTLMPDR